MLLRIIFSWKNSPQWAASLFRRTQFTNLFSSRVVRPVPSWNECACGRLWSSRSTGCHSFPVWPTVFLHCPPAQSFVLWFDLLPALQIDATGCHSFSSTASKHSRDSQNISHVRTYKMGSEDKGGKKSFKLQSCVVFTS